jgi:hypothetical protein
VEYIVSIEQCCLAFPFVLGDILICKWEEIVQFLAAVCEQQSKLFYLELSQSGNQYCPAAAPAL